MVVEQKGKRKEDKNVGRNEEEEKEREGICKKEEG